MSRPLLSMFIEPDPSDDELLFARQLGVDCVYTWIKTQQCTYEYLARLRERVESHGLHLYNVGNMDVAKNDKIHLALPGRDRVIADFQAFVADLGRAGIGVTTFTWEPTQVWSSAPGETRGAQARAVDLDEMLQRPYTHGRAYSEDEIWDNYTTFIRQMMPVCAEAGVRLALHPNDPPSPQPLGGIPCLIHSFDTYKRAFAIADSSAASGVTASGPSLGMEFCCGCWLEGGAGFGDIFEGIRAFTAEDRILIVHFRNVTAPLPVFTETFLDNGYADMYRVMKTFVQDGYRGTMILDHSPKFAGEYARGGGTAYAIGYMRALMERALDELSAK
jgi:mannonate dehydratase